MHQMEADLLPCLMFSVVVVVVVVICFFYDMDSYFTKYFSATINEKGKA